MIDPRIERLVGELIGRVADKWTMPVLEALAEKGTLRFTQIGKALPAISQKMLTQTLRAMEREGLVARNVAAQGRIQPDWPRLHTQRSLLRSRGLGCGQSGKMRNSRQPLPEPTFTGIDQSESGPQFMLKI